LMMGDADGGAHDCRVCGKNTERREIFDYKPCRLCRLQAQGPLPADPICLVRPPPRMSASLEFVQIGLVWLGCPESDAVDGSSHRYVVPASLMQERRWSVDSNMGVDVIAAGRWAPKRCQRNRKKPCNPMPSKL